MAQTATFQFQLMSPEADRGRKGEGGESNSSIRCEMHFPINSSTTPRYFIANFTMAEVRLFLGSSSTAYQQLFQWANEPSSRPENGVMTVTEAKDFNDVRTFLSSYPNTIISNIEL
jgi:hypothetical protein